MIFKIGSSGPDVAAIQKALGVAADGRYGAVTQQAVKTFQQKKGLNADGIVGALTWKQLFNAAMPEPAIGLPIYQSECKSLFGSPLDSAFFHTWITKIQLNGANRVWQVECNLVLVQPLQRAWANLKATGLLDRIKTYDGCWVVRNTRGGNSLSMHAYGLAIDFNAATNPFHSYDFDMPVAVVECFETAGFTAGARWNPPDAMHFQLPKVR